MQIKIEKKDKLYQFDAATGEPLLFAGLRAGIPLPYECATGTCGTCKGRLSGGDIDHGWADAPGRKNHKEARKEFLMCQARAVNDCEVVIPSKIKSFRSDDFVPDYYQGTTSGWSYLTEDVVRFEVKLEAGVEYHPGQFFVIQAPGIEGFRAYSMVNYSGKTDSLEFIIKLKPGGGFSRWVESQRNSQATLTSTVNLFGPLGQATFHADEDHDLLMITGGSGIAGLMSILEHASTTDYLRNHRIRLFFGVRTLADLFFSDRLLALKNHFDDNFHVDVVLSAQDADGVDAGKYPGINFSDGFVHERALEAVSVDETNTMIYMAGPQPMIDAAIRPLVLEAKVPADRIRFDKFS